MIARLKAAVVAFVRRPAVQSAARHAAFAGLAVLVAAVTVGGIHSVTVGVLVSALAAVGRVLQLAVVAQLSGKSDVTPPAVAAVAAANPSATNVGSAS